jgi:hypothetical protein
MAAGEAVQESGVVGKEGTVVELLFEKKGLIPTVQQLFILQADR